MYSLSQQDTSRDNRLNMLVESRVRREVQARFGGEFLETYRRNTARHRVLSLRLTAQYLVLFVAGLLGVFVCFAGMYMSGVPQGLCILFALTAEEYEALHGAWLKALKVLPDYTVVHNPDFFLEERYTAPEEGSERSFLARSYERHFNERPYLRHTCYLFVTKTTPERMRQTSASSVLCRGFIVPREMRDTDAFVANEPLTG